MLCAYVLLHLQRSHKCIKIHNLIITNPNIANVKKLKLPIPRVGSIFHLVLWALFLKSSLINNGPWLLYFWVYFFHFVFTFRSCRNALSGIPKEKISRGTKYYWTLTETHFRCSTIWPFCVKYGTDYTVASGSLHQRHVTENEIRRKFNFHQLKIDTHQKISIMLTTYYNWPKFVCSLIISRTCDSSKNTWHAY